jgi:hypothetical protein
LYQEATRMSGIEIRLGRRLVIRAAGRSAVALTVLGLLAAFFIVVDHMERRDTVRVVWREVATR